MPARLSPLAEKVAVRGGVTGMIPVVDTIDGERVVHLIPWHQAARQHSVAKGETQDHWALPDPTDADVTEQVIKTLPPDTHVPHRERYRLLVRKLLADRATLGEWPASIQAELRAMGWRSGRPTLLQEVEALADYHIKKAANEQRLNDQRHITVDHNARYSA